MQHRGPRLIRIIYSLFLLLCLRTDSPAAGAATNFWRDAADSSPLTLRAETMNLPLYGGIPLYGDMFAAFKDQDFATTGTFHDKADWTARFNRLHDLRLNALVIIHPHPFPVFVDYAPDYPEANWLRPDQLTPKREMMRWIIAAAQERGIKLYFLTWNIWLPRGFAQAHFARQEDQATTFTAGFHTKQQVAQDGHDTPLTRQFTAFTIRRFFETYPGFGGLITMGAESPPGCAGFVAEAIARPMGELTPRPQLIYWNWCTYPAQARQVQQAYAGATMFMHYLQYETLFYPKSDPRIREVSRALGDAPMVGLGGPKSQHWEMFFGDPKFIHDLVQDFHASSNGRGLLIEDVGEPTRWLAEMAFARYAWSPEEPYNDALWRETIARRYGAPELAAPLLVAMREASQIVMTQLKLTHSQSDHFALQHGISLGQILEMPTLSSYIFENSQTVGLDGMLSPNMGLSHPNPDWGERVLPIRQWVLGQLPDENERKAKLEEWITERRGLGYAPHEIKSGDRTPAQVLAELEGQVERGENALKQAAARRDKATTATAELERVLGQIELNFALGHFLLAKNKAAIAWERYRWFGEEIESAQCLTRLDEAALAWDHYATLSDKFYGGARGFWVAQTKTPPPWSQNDLWFSYTMFKGTHADVAKLWKKEREIVVQRLAAAKADASLRQALTPPSWLEMNE